MTDPASSAAPVSAKERITDMDVLRGFALLGVFIANIVFFNAHVVSTEEQRAALSTAGIDGWTELLVNLFVNDKANTLFAFLFGLGFYVQMDRLSQRFDNFVAIYARRLTVLLAFGLFHLAFIWVWEILTLYAVCGFLLLLFRNASDRVVILLGLLFGLAGRPIVELGLELSGLGASLGVDALYEAPAILVRQALSETGDYWGLVGNFWDYTLLDWFLTAGVGWIIYALGRFLVGMWVGRKGWIARADDYLPGFRKVFLITLPAGLLLQLGAEHTELLGEAPWIEILNSLLHTFATPLIAAGYVSGIVLALRTGWGGKVFGLLAPVGKMALTNYVTQSFIIGYVLFGVGPGLDLMGEIGITQTTLIAIGGFAGQVVFSHIWLRFFNFGPLEWAWRALTYGTLPVFRRA
ncbi:DUF418 domain-containing protein [Hyphobacterium sp. HN65]|uniref:DUF418 domain-containing protein n=1 Tax=Hyphobacterium lacteum TaxID=3116575 RepID=A0ABU7LPF4_9PROT|nr:DUF418 domain-containing protein [Hyphobacterium sp. HN65]MEE2525772.1 DUF418 domain-containing protein [Hyphobacterium sp. HN65]